MVLAAEFPAIPSSAAKIASERRCAILVHSGEHWTGSPSKSTDRIGKTCPKNVRKLSFQPLRTVFGRFPNIFSASFEHFVDIPFTSILATKNPHLSLSQRAPNPPEFAQPRLSRVKARSSPVRGYKFGCVCSYMASHEDAGVVTGHIGTNTRPNLYPLAGDDSALTLLKRGCANSVVALALADSQPGACLTPLVLPAW